MTTIAFRDGVMASDSQVSSEGGTRLGRRTKVRRIGASLFGFAGGVDDVERAAHWFEWLARPRGFFPSLATMPRPQFAPGTTLTVLEATNGEVRLYGAGLVAEPLRAEFFAIGSGRDFALGAMAVGGTAQQAVKAAIEFDVYTGGPIQALSLSPCEPESGVRE